MTRLEVEIESSNAAFSDGNAPEECALILLGVAQKLRGGYESGSLLDTNGNTVGRWTLQQEDDDDD